MVVVVAVVVVVVAAAEAAAAVVVATSAAAVSTPDWLDCVAAVSQETRGLQGPTASNN